jgi:hypothetical protein
MELDVEDHLLVPAGPIRIVSGCLMMAGGVFLAALTTHNWVKVIGLLMFVVAPFVMLKRPVKETQAFEERE